MKRKVTLITLFVFLFVFLTAGCGSNGQVKDNNSTALDESTANTSTVSGNAETTGETRAKEQVLNVSFFNFGFLDPSRTQTTYGDWMLKDMYEPLVRINTDGTLKAGNGLAASIEHSKDYKTYTFKLKNNCTWENGDPVTAKDFIYSFKRTMDPKVASPYVNNLFIINNAEEYYKGKAGIEQVGATALDDYTLQLTLKNPILEIEPLLTSAVFLPQNEKFTEQAGEKLGTAPEYLLTCGPFKCMEIKAEEKITMEKNLKYYEADKVSLNKIIYNAIGDPNTSINLYESGDIDFTFYIKNLAPQYDKSKEEIFMTNPNSNYIYFNQKGREPYLMNKKIRRALTLGMDATPIANTIALGYKPSYGVGSIGQKGPDGIDYGEFVKNEKYYYFDAAEAKKLLDEGLKELDITPEQFAKAVTFDICAFYEQWGLIIQQQWLKNLGVDIKLNVLSDSEGINALSSSNFDITIMQIDSPSSDPIFTLAWLKSGNTSNYGGYSNPEYDALIDKAAATITNERYEYCKQLERILADDGAVFPVNMATVPMLCDTKLRNVRFCPLVFGFEEKNIYKAE